MTSHTTRLGWLGTGRMGAAMAARLIDACEPVTVWNRTRAKRSPWRPRARPWPAGSRTSANATSCSSWKRSGVR